MLLLLIVTTGCNSDAKSTKNSGNEMTQNCLDLYDKFLKGEISVSSESNQSSKIDINQLFQLDENDNKYTMFDSNHNGIPELHLSSMREYIILECINDKLRIIYSGSGYESLLNNGALLYSRTGGAPEHISYMYTELDADDITFEKYNTMNDNSDDDLYLFEDDEVTKSDFDAKTNKYLSTESDLIIWSNYRTFLAEKQPYTIATATFSQDNIKIEYPQIKGIEYKSKNSRGKFILQWKILRGIRSEKIFINLFTMFSPFSCL